MRKNILKFDKSNMIDFLINFPGQVENAVSLGNALDISIVSEKINTIVLCGMGGSAIGGDILRSYLENKSTIPVYINRNYEIPGFINKYSLIFISSYSGNTEETLNAYKRALKKSDNIICITSGGKLSDLAQRDDIPIISIPSGFQPRAALGFSFFPLLLLLSKTGILKKIEDEIEETIAVLKKLLKEYFSDEKSIPYSSALKLVNKLPVIYSCSPLYEPIALRWKCQICENSKVLAYYNVFPELDHNEITGWESDYEILKYMTVIILRDKKSETLMSKRIEFTKEIINDKCHEIIEFFSEGEFLLTRMFSLIYLGDFISYYLALLNHKDPTSIRNIENLKQKLKNS